MTELAEEMGRGGVAECVFCGIVAGEKPARIVYRDDLVTAFHDIRPVAPTHILVIPNRHVESLAQLDGNDGDLFGRLVSVANRIAREAGMADQGYRVVANCGRDGGQTVFHLHLHLLGGRRMTWPPG